MQVLPQFYPSVSLTITNHSNETLASSIQDLGINEPVRPFIFTALITLCLLTIILLTILGNILVLIAIFIDFALRSPTHLLMGNLACADLLLGITVLPFSGTLEILQGRWLFGRTFCHVWLAIDVLYCTASIYGLMFISIERYIGVTSPLRYPIIITHRRTIYAILLAWIVAAIVSITPFFGWHNKVKSDDRSCVVNDDLSYVLFSCLFSFYIPLIVILCVYGRVYGEANRQYRFLTGGQKKVHLKQLVGQEAVTLRVHLPRNLSQSISNGHSARSLSNSSKLASISTNGSSKISRMKRERKAAKTLGIVVGMFILCWFPFFLLLPIKALTSNDMGIVFSICFWLGYCNSCFNPFIYAFSSREFRRAFKSILKCERMKKKKPSVNFYRVSTQNSDQFRRKRSNSHDIRNSRLLSKSGPFPAYRESIDDQHGFRSSISSPYYVNTARRISRHECIAHSPNQKTVPSACNTSPWHMRASFSVRS